MGGQDEGSRVAVVAIGWREYHCIINLEYEMPQYLKFIKDTIFIPVSKVDICKLQSQIFYLQIGKKCHIIICSTLFRLRVKVTKPL